MLFKAHVKPILQLFFLIIGLLGLVIVGIHSNKKPAKGVEV